MSADVPRLESIAQQLAARLREDDPVRVWAWLTYELPEPKDWYRLCFVLACAVPDDRTWGDLTGWARDDLVEKPVDRGAYEALVEERFGPRPGRREAA